MSDDEADRSIARTFNRAIVRAGYADKLSEAQWDRAERAFADEAPDPANAEGWVRDYFAGWEQLGAPAQPATPSPAPQPKRPRSEVPITADMGSPAPQNPAHLWSRIIDMTPAEVESLVAELGVRGYAERFKQEMRGVRVNVKR